MDLGSKQETAAGFQQYFLQCARGEGLGLAVLVAGVT